VFKDTQVAVAQQVPKELQDTKEIVVHKGYKGGRAYRELRAHLLGSIR
tara:strand:- start:676 stop:819 length:144 start_codon:yes stop_codon:yes gene_type:complete